MNHLEANLDDGQVMNRILMIRITQGRGKDDAGNKILPVSG
jgi:hypothetical protein